MRFGIVFVLSRSRRFALSRRAIRRLADLGALAVATSGFGGCPSQRWSRMSAGCCEKQLARRSDR